jgi:PhnB protein
MINSINKLTREVCLKTTLQAYLHGSIDAVDFYQKAFDATLGYNVRNPDGTFMHAELYVDGVLLLALSESNNDIARENRMKYSATTYPAMNFCVSMENEQAVKKAYDILKEDANILYPLGPLPWNTCCANLVDKFGIFWYISV